MFCSLVPDSRCRDFRDDSVFCHLNSSYVFVIPKIASLSSCHPGRPSGAMSIRDPEANPNLFYFWVPDTVRLATLAHSSGTTVFFVISILLMNLSSRKLRVSPAVIPEDRAKRGLSGIQDPIFLLLGPGSRPGISNVARGICSSLLSSAFRVVF